MGHPPLSTPCRETLAALATLGGSVTDPGSATEALAGVMKRPPSAIQQQLSRTLYPQGYVRKVGNVRRTYELHLTPKGWKVLGLKVPTDGGESPASSSESSSAPAQPDTPTNGDGSPLSHPEPSVVSSSSDVAEGGTPTDGDGFDYHRLAVSLLHAVAVRMAEPPTNGDTTKEIQGYQRRLASLIEERNRLATRLNQALDDKRALSRERDALAERGRAVEANLRRFMDPRNHVQDSPELRALRRMMSERPASRKGTD